MSTSDPSALVVARATADDAADIFAWRNDPHTRAMSLGQAPIAWTTHANWFMRALADPMRRLYLGRLRDGGGKVGVCRFDLAADRASAEVSIHLAPARRGLGLSVPLLSACIADYLHDHRVVLTATIRPDNTASLRCFTACGFVVERATPAPVQLRRHLPQPPT